jgi:hypothetical protein
MSVGAEGPERRLEELDRQRLEQIAQANEALAAAQDKSYWLDRWHVDLNALMARRGAGEFRALLRALRAVYRMAREARAELPNLAMSMRRARREVAEDRATAARILSERAAPAGDLVAEVLGSELTRGQVVLALGGANNGLADRLRASRPDVAWQAVDLPEQPPLGALDASFDHALALDESDALGWLGEVHRLVRPGGRFVLAARAPDQLLAQIGRDWHMVGFHRTAEDRDLYVLERV